MRLFATALLGTAALSSVATEPLSPRLYQMTTHTGMPHLDESLRYAVLREQRCLDPRDLSSAFWILGHESMQGCRLDKAEADADADTAAARYLLLCTGSSGTTGHANWQLGPGQISGTLDVKLGGKNMTFYQRIVATPLGPCPQQ